MQIGKIPPGAPFQTQDILGVCVVAATSDKISDFVAERFARGETQKIAFFNSNLAITAGEDAPRLLSDFIVLNDGLAIDVAGRLLNGARFPDNLNGTDFTPRLLRKLPDGARVFLYGSRPKVVARAAERLAREGVAICGFRDGYGGSGAEAAKAARLAGAQVVLVALGNPRQERWIDEHGKTTGATLFLGVGALFDFLSGAVVRAPRIVRQLRLEWLFRLLREPLRLGRRYTVEMGNFFLLVLRERRRRRRAAEVATVIQTPQSGQS